MPNPMSLPGKNESASRSRAAAGLSIVVPLFNEADNLPNLHARIVETARRLRDARQLIAEVIYVDDGSRDGTWEEIGAASLANPAVRGISLSRNFGHQGALLAGLNHARGRAVVTMDGDLQHPPATVL